MPTWRAEIVRKLYRLWMEREFESGADLHAPDCVYDWSRRQIEPTVVTGPEAAARSLAAVRDPWDEAEINIERIVEDGERVIVLFHIRGRGRLSSAVTDAHAAHIWTIRDGLIRRFEYWGDGDAALATIEGTA